MTAVQIPAPRRARFVSHGDALFMLSGGALNPPAPGTPEKGSLVGRALAMGDSPEDAIDRLTKRKSEPLYIALYIQADVSDLHAELSGIDETRTELFFQGATTPVYMLRDARSYDKFTLAFQDAQRLKAANPAIENFEVVDQTRAAQLVLNRAAQHQEA